jgi:hypothetical protein
MDTQPTKIEQGLLDAAEIDRLESRIIDEMAIVLAAIARGIHAKEVETNKNLEMNITQACKTQPTTK